MNAAPAPFQSASLYVGDLNNEVSGLYHKHPPSLGYLILLFGLPFHDIYC
jgi:hypothetical protein